MRNDDLRQQLGSLLQPIREAMPPDLPVIRRRLTRLRRRRVRTAGMSAVATVAAVAIGVVAVHAATGRTGNSSSGGSPAAVSPTDTSPATSGAPSPVGNGFQSTTSYTVNSPITSLVVSGDVGGISVTGSQRATTSVTATMYYTTNLPTLTRTLSGSTLTLGYSCPSNDDCGVRFDIQVPSATAVRATDDVGAINAENLTSGIVSLQTDTGAISASLLAPPTSLHASSNVGAITIGVPRDASYRVDASTAVGGTNVSVPEDQSSRHSIIAKTGTGRISIVTGTVAPVQDFSPNWQPGSGVPTIGDTVSFPPCFPFCSTGTGP